MIRSTLLAFALLFSSGAVAATLQPDPEEPGAPSPESIASAQDKAMRMTIPVMVNGHGPYPFIVDTGADRSVISRELADTLKLPGGQPLLMHNTAGVERVPSVAIDSLGFGHHEIHGVAAPVLSAANIGADGMLGLDSLRDQHVVMDFHQKTFFTGPSREATSEIGPFSIVVEGRRLFGQLVLVDAESRGTPIFVILDTGAQNTVGNPALQRLMERHDATPGHVHVTDVISVTGNTTPAEVNQMPSIRLGGIEIQNVPIAYASLHTFTEFDLDDRPAMLLGMDVLRNFHRVAVDFTRREAVFTPE